MLNDTDVLARALELPARQRAAIAQKLLESLDAGSIDPDVDDAWADEIELRAAAYDRGETKSSDAHEVIERVRRSITGGRSA